MEDVSESTRHRLLVAAPNLGDANFERTVVLMVEHNEAGAVGLVLNRPSETAVEEHLPHLTDLVGAPDVFFIGGPVGIGGVLALGLEEPGGRPPATTPVCGPIHVLDPERVVNRDLDGIEMVRLFTGYAGWGEGQLEAELLAGGWIVVDPVPEDLIPAEPGELWRSVLGRQPAPVSRLALFPDDVRVN